MRWIRAGQGSAAERAETDPDDAEGAAALRARGFVPEFVPDPEIAAAFPAFLARMGEGAPVGPSRGERARLEQQWSRPLPPELAAFVDWREARALRYPSVGEWRVWGEEIAVPDPADGNLLERAILADQENYLGTSLLEIACGLVWLGSLGNGDGWFASLDARHPENAEVLYWDHEARWVQKTAADSLGALAWANRLVADHGGDDPLPEAALAAAWARLDGRFSPTWHFSALTESTGHTPTCEDASPARYYQARAAFLIALLRGPRRDLRDVAEAFAYVDHGRVGFAQVLGGPHLATNPITAFYWCWRLWLFGKDAELAACLDACAGSASPLVRDIGALVAEVRDGRTALGKLTDLPALRAAFQALDLDPDRAEARAREAAEREAEAARAADQDRATAAGIAAGTDVVAIVEAGWAHLGNATVLDPLRARLAELAPELADDLARLRFVEEGGHSRNGHSYDTERQDVLEALHAADRRLAPWLLSGPRDLWAAGAAAAAGDPRLVPLLAGRLALGAEWLHDATAAIEALGRAGRPAEVAPLLAEASAQIGWGIDFRTQLRAKDAQRAIFEALARCGGPAAYEVLAAAVAGGAKELVPRALVALGRLGDPRGDALAVAALPGDHREAALFALGRLPTAAGLAALDGECRTRGAPERTAVARLHREHARSLAGHAPDLDVARFALELLLANPRSTAELHETALALLARHAPRDEALATLRAWIDDEHRQVREAALAGLAALGAPVAPVWCDRPTIARRVERDGPAALAALAGAPGAALRWGLVRKAAEVGGFGPALRGVVAWATRFPRAARGYASSDARPRLDAVLSALGDLATPEADALLGELAGHPNPMVRQADVFKYGAAKARLVAAPVRTAPPAPGTPRVAVAVAPLGASPWLHGVAIRGLAALPDGRLLIASDGASGAMSPAGVGAPFGPALAGRRGMDVAASPDGTRAALAAHGGQLCVIDPATGAILAELRGHGGVPSFVARAAFSPSGRWLASVSNDHTLRVWDAAGGEALARVDGGCDLDAVAWLDDDRVVFGGDRVVGVADRAGTVLARTTLAAAEVGVHAGRVYVGGPREIAVLGPDLAPIGALKQARALRFAFRGDALFALSYEGADRGLWRWDLATGRRKRWKGAEDDGALRALALDPAGCPRVGGADPRVRRWDAKGKLLASEALFHPGEVEAVAEVDGRRWTAGAGGALRWGPGGADRHHPTASRATGVARSGDVLVVATSDLACAFDAATGEPRWTLPLGRCEGVVALADGFCLGSGRALVFVDRAGAVRAEVPCLGDGWVATLLGLPDGRVLASGYRAPDLQVFDGATAACVARWPLPPRGGRADSYGLAVGAGRLWISRWNETIDSAPLPPPDAAPDWDLTIALPGSWAPVAPSPDGRHVLAGDLVVDVATGLVAGRLGLPSEPTAAQWTADGLVVGTKGGAAFRVTVSG